MHVTSIRYQPVEGGALGGHFALHVTLGASDGPSVFSATELSTRIHDAFEVLGIKGIHGVLIDCRAAAPTAEEMMSLLGTLRDWNYFVNLWVGELVRYPWFEIARYITVFVTRKNWPNFKCNEIRYVPPESGEWTEPEIYDVNTLTPGYVLPRTRNTADLLKFVTSAKRPWGVVLTSQGMPPAIDFKLKA